MPEGSAGGSGSQADALVHLSWSAPKGTVVTVRWVPGPADPAPGPPPPPVPPPNHTYTAHDGVLCGSDLGAVTKVAGASACKALCDADPSCLFYEAATDLGREHFATNCCLEWCSPPGMNSWDGAPTAQCQQWVTPEVLPDSAPTEC